MTTCELVMSAERLREWGSAVSDQSDRVRFWKKEKLGRHVLVPSGVWLELQVA